MILVQITLSTRARFSITSLFSNSVMLFPFFLTLLRRKAQRSCAFTFVPKTVPFQDFFAFPDQCRASVFAEAADVGIPERYAEKISHPPVSLVPGHDPIPPDLIEASMSADPEVS